MLPRDDSDSSLSCIVSPESWSSPSPSEDISYSSGPCGGCGVAEAGAAMANRCASSCGKGSFHHDGTSSSVRRSSSTRAGAPIGRLRLDCLLLGAEVLVVGTSSCLKGQRSPQLHLPCAYSLHGVFFFCASVNGVRPAVGCVVLGLAAAFLFGAAAPGRVITTPVAWATLSSCAKSHFLPLVQVPIAWNLQ